ncbi:hypothetical protein BT69DRAFT_1326047 [Atractiella rhizophila]|nr:hypothetical protein BT69DRAFT_1326047 [Atractiella rhizophila]
MVTLLGFGCIMINFLTLLIFSHDLAAAAPSWVYTSFAIGLFCYQTMDNVDGKQARRLSLSSPLGELFDHSIDTLNCGFGALIICATLATGHSGASVFLLLIGCWPMCLSTWEEYHTGILFLGFINGPTEGLLIAMATQLVSAIHGPEFWRQTAWDTLGQLPWTNAATSMLDVYLAFVLLCFVGFHAPACFINVYRSIPPNDSRRRVVMFSVFELTPMVLLTALFSAWCFGKYSIIMQDKWLVPMALILTFSFGKINSKVILAQLTRGGFPYSLNVLLPFLIGATLANYPSLGLPALPHSVEKWYICYLLFSAFASYSVQAWRTIDAFCKTLNINALTVKSGSGRRVLTR